MPEGKRLPDAATIDANPPTSAGLHRAWAAAFTLMAANSLAFIDRQALAFLMQPIKMDLGASDTAMSFIYGFSFTLFYIGVGIPLAWLADRSNRRNIVMNSILFWSVATAACGLARSYTALIAARVAVGAGESGLGPASYSLLADYFPREKLPTALGLYQAGIYLGGALALFIGAFIADTFPLNEYVRLPVIGNTAGWQIMFLLLGIPGILLALIVRLTIREPVRKNVSLLHKSEAASFVEVFHHFNNDRRFYFGLMGSFVLVVFVGNGTGAWIPAFLAREYGMLMGDIGRSYGLTVLFCGISGCIIGGWLSGKWQQQGRPHGNLIAPLIGIFCLIPVTIGFPLMPTATGAMVMIGFMNFFAGFNLGGGLAALLERTPNRLRAQVSMVYVVAINLLGASLGPLVIALVTDYIFMDPQRLGDAIALVCAAASPLALMALIFAMQAMKMKQIPAE